MGRRFAAAWVAALLASSAQSQMVQHWLPARAELHGVLSGNGAQVQVLEGVPGERMSVRLTPKGSVKVGDWAVDVLQPDEDTQTFLAGPGGTIVLDPMQFGSDGAVALRLRSLAGSGGKYVLRARSKFPAGFSHPQVALLAGEPGSYESSTWLRPGLTLRARVQLPHAAAGWPLQSLPHFLVTPPELVAPAYETDAGLPDTLSGQPYPDVVTLKTSFDFSHVEFSLGAEGLALLGVRVRSHKTVIGKVSHHHPPGPSGGSQPAPPTFLAMQLDKDELLPGEPVHLTAVVNGKGTQCPDPTATVRVWLSSIHRIDGNDVLGWPLAGPVEVPLAYDGFTFESDLQVPPDVPPGLYGVWVVLDEPGGPISDCGNLFHGKRAATVLKVRQP